MLVYFTSLNHNEFAAYVTASTRLEFKKNKNARIIKADAKKFNKKHDQKNYCFECYIRGHRSDKCQNKEGGIWNPEGKRKFTKLDWWDNKIPHPATKGKQQKKIKKTKEKELEETAK